MDGNENYGLILKLIRQKSDLSVRELARRIGKSIGWISEVENGSGLARLSEGEFNRLVGALGADKYRPMFKTWVANHKNAQHTDRLFDGAVLKFVRKKKDLTLKEVAKRIELSSAHISRIERGRSPSSVELRKRYMEACGYSASSFKNLSSNPKRSKLVPSKFKLEILLKQLPESRFDDLLKYIQSIIEEGAQ
jgi:transcriptional regulator with XRE-family HTH domain